MRLQVVADGLKSFAFVRSQVPPTGDAMRASITIAFATAVVALGVSAAVPADIKPAVVFDIGGKFDKSFNEGVSVGAEKFKAETKIGYAEFEVTNETQFEQAHRRFAQRGQDPIVGVGFNQANPIERVAKEFPKVHFTLIDGVVKLPNVQSVLFKEHEGSFLVGLLAAMASKSGKIGFVGGMDIPLIRKFACGYEQGIKYGNPKAELIQNMTGTTPAAWNDPARGGELAKGQFDRGVDVIYAAAGATGNGVLQAAKDRGKLAIGVDSNQNHLHPGTMLTSMVKRVDLVTYESFKTATEGKWEAGISVLGLKEGGVDWALDQYNEKLITPEMKAKVDQAKADIIAGKIKVHDYMSNSTCTY
jgi:basic membrane protein A and related proteins